VVGDDGELGEAAGGRAQPRARHRGAQLLQATLAVVAAPARDERHDRDAVSGDQSVHLRSGVRHDRGELVPEDLGQLGTGERMRLGRDHDRAGRVLVQVGAADAAPLRAEQHLVGLEIRGLPDVLDPDVTCGVEDGGLHREPLPWSDRRRE
jgi:hypothetical protein